MAYVILIVCGVVFLIIWFLFPFLVRKTSERRLSARCMSGRFIVLSYDDGPGDTLTPELLKLLKQREVRATFFLMGCNVTKRQSLAEWAVLDGHEVGSHTYHHSNAWKTGPTYYWRDLTAGVKAVDAVGGFGMFFRPPYGKMTLAGLISGLWAGLRYGWWTIDSRDSWQRRAVEEVLDEIEKKGGGVVLMHDLDAYDAKKPHELSHKDHVLALTLAILDLAEIKNYRVRSLGYVMGHNK